jgi:hypothetical protein
MLIQSIGAVVPATQAAWLWLSCEFGVEKWRKFQEDNPIMSAAFSKQRLHHGLTALQVRRYEKTKSSHGMEAAHDPL